MMFYYMILNREKETKFRQIALYNSIQHKIVGKIEL